MTLAQAILRGNPRAVATLADRIRNCGGTWQDTVDHVQNIFKKAGEPVPDPATIDGWLYETEWEAGYSH